jgi:hypothetical protein
MKVSVDGLRRNLARAYCKTVRGYQDHKKDDNDIYALADIKDGLDDLRQMIGAFMCMYSDDPDDLMTNMTDEAEKLPFANPKENEK